VNKNQEKMLKKIISESNTPGYDNRKFGDPLPTLASVQKAYQKKTSVKEEESPDDNELLDALKAKLSDEGGAAGFQDLADKAADMGVQLTPEMLEDMPGIMKHRDGDYILEQSLEEAAPRMKVESWHKELDQATQSILRAERMLKLDQPGTHGKIKKSFLKTIKTLQQLKSDTRRF
jgi:hypothetical protein